MGKLSTRKPERIPSEEIQGRILSGFAGPSLSEQLKAYELALGPKNVSASSYVEAEPSVMVKRNGKWVQPDNGIDIYDLTTDVIPDLPAILGGSLGAAYGGTQGAVGGATIGNVVKQRIGEALGLRDGVNEAEAKLEGIGELVGPIGGKALAMVPMPFLAAFTKNTGEYLASPSEQELKMALAQKNAVELLGLHANNTPLERAAAMGFDTDVYHGKKPTKIIEDMGGGSYITLDTVNEPLTEVHPGKGRTEGGALWSTSDPSLASLYAGGTKDYGAVYPLKVRSIDLAEYGVPPPKIDASDAEWKKYISDTEKFNRSIDKSKSRYFANAASNDKGAAIIRSVEDSPGSSFGGVASDIVASNTNPVRSRFAAFDPAQINSRDIMASLAAISAALGYSRENE